MWQVIGGGLLAGLARGNDGGSIAGGYQARIQDFTKVQQHARTEAAATPVEGPAAEIKKAGLAEDIATLERYAGDPALKGAREALGQGDLGRAATLIEQVATARLEALDKSLANLKDPEKAEAAVASEEQDIAPAEEALSEAEDKHSAAKDAASEASEAVTDGIASLQDEWPAFEQKTQSLLASIPSHGPEEKAVLKALRDKEPVQLATALQALQKKYKDDGTEVGNKVCALVPDILGNTGDGEVTLNSTLAAIDTNVSAQSELTAATQKLDAAKARLTVEQREFNDAKAAVGVAEEYQSADKEVTDMARQMTAAWDNPENAQFVDRAKIIAGMVPDTPPAAAAAKKAIQEAIVGGDPVKLLQAFKDAQAALPREQQPELHDEIKRLMDVEFITAPHWYGDDKVKLTELDSKVAAREHLNQEISRPVVQTADEVAPTAPPEAEQEVVPENPAPADVSRATTNTPDIRALVGPLTNQSSDADIEAALARLAKRVATPPPLSAEDRKAISDGLGDIVAKRLEESTKDKLPLSESNTRKDEVKALQRALMLADIVSGDDKVRDIGSQRTKDDFDVDGYFGGATRQSLNDIQGARGLPAGGPADAGTIAALQRALRGQPEPAVRAAEPPPVQLERQEPPPDQTGLTSSGVTEVPKDPAPVEEKKPLDRRAIREVNYRVATVVFDRVNDADGIDKTQIKDAFKEYEGKPVSDELVAMVLAALRSAPHAEGEPSPYELLRRAIGENEEDIKAAVKAALEKMMTASAGEQLAFLDLPPLPWEQQGNESALA